MVRKKEFCKLCGVLLKRNMFGKLKDVYEYRDGIYCEDCSEKRPADVPEIPGRTPAEAPK